MRIVIIGGTRFIGAAVVGLLADAGHEVVLFHRGRTEPSAPLRSVHHIHGERAELRAFRTPFRELRPEVVIDMVLRTEQEALITARTFAGVASRLIVASSVDVYRNYERLHGWRGGPPDPAPLSEDAPLRETRYPRRRDAAGVRDWRYDYDKLEVERVCRAHELPVTVLRLPFVYGPGDYRRRLAPVLRQLDEGRGVLIDAPRAAHRCSRGYVDNVAAAIVLAATDRRAEGRVYNVGEEPALSEAEWITTIGRLAGSEGGVTVEQPTTAPRGDAAAPTDWRQHLVVDTSTIRRELGYREPVDLATGMRRTIAWERTHGSR